MSGQHWRLIWPALSALVLAALGVVTWLWKPLPLSWGWLEPASWVATLVGTPIACLLAILAWRRPTSTAVQKIGRSEGRLLPVSQFSTAWSGVHPTIKISGEGRQDAPSSRAENAPPYIARTIDQELRQTLTLVCESRRGFVLLLGNSATGKTRSAHEAVTSLFPNWDIFIPATAEDVRGLLERPLKKPVVVWLDELQKFLSDSGESGLGRETLFALWSSRKPVVIVATLWPSRYQAYMKAGDLPNGSPDHRLDRVREVLRLAECIYVDDDLDGAERAEATRLSKVDQRIRYALRDSDYGVIQVLAGAPDLVYRWQHADPYAKAIINGAIDIRRVGVEGALSGALLRQVAEVYLGREKSARATADWFESGIRYSTELLKGATSVLIPKSGRLVGSVEGYDLADYLASYGVSERAAMSIRQEVWDALAQHTHNPSELAELALSAQTREILGYAEVVYKRALALGSTEAGFWLGLMLDGQGRTEESLEILLRAARMGNPDALEMFSEIAPPDEAIRELHKALGEGRQLPDGDLRVRLATILYEQGEESEAEGQFRRAMEEGRWEAYYYYALLLEDSGRTEEALELYVKSTSHGQDAGFERASALLAKSGKIDEARKLYERSLEISGEDAHAWWIRLLVEAGELNEAVKIAERCRGHFQVGRALERLDRFDEALKAYQRVLEQGDSWGHSYIADVLERLERYGEALPHRVKVLSFDSYFGPFEFVRHLTRAGRVDLSIALYERYLERGLNVMSDELMVALVEARRIPELVELVGRSVVRGGDGGETYTLCQLLVKHGYGEIASKLRMHGFGADGTTAVPIFAANGDREDG